MSQDEAQGRGDQVRDYLEKARDDLASNGQNEAAGSINALLEDDKFKDVLRLMNERQPANPQENDAELDSTGLETQIDRALQAAVETGMPSGKIEEAKRAISSYQSSKSNASKAAVEQAVAAAGSEARNAEDEAAKKTQHAMTNALLALGLTTALPTVSEAFSSFAKCCSGVEDEPRLPHQVGVPVLLGAGRDPRGKDQNVLGA